MWSFTRHSRPTLVALGLVWGLAACGDSLPTTMESPQVRGPQFLYSAEYYGVLADEGCQPEVDPMCELRILYAHEYNILWERAQTLCAEIRDIALLMLQNDQIMTWDERIERGNNRYLNGDYHFNDAGQQDDELHLYSGNWSGTSAEQAQFGRTFAHELYHYLHPEETDENAIWTLADNCVSQQP